MCKKSVLELPDLDPQKKERKLSEMSSKTPDTSPRLSNRREERTGEKISRRQAPSSPITQ